MTSESSFIEECIGPVDRLVISTCRFVDDATPRDQWPLSFIVDYVEEGPEGGTLGLWHGRTYREAIAAAKELAEMFDGLPIIDRTARGTLQ